MPNAVSGLLVPPLPRGFPLAAHVEPQLVNLKAEDGAGFANQLFLPRDLRPGELSSGPGLFTVANARLFFAAENLNLIRLSNLLTTRSDTFTTYVLVQGWKNAGTEYPQLVAEKRAAFMTDRSKVYSGNATVESFEVPAK